MKIETQRISQFSQLASLIKSKQNTAVEASGEHSKPIGAATVGSEGVLGGDSESADAAGSEME
jgi:hypothetical protein